MARILLIHGDERFGPTLRREFRGEAHTFVQTPSIANGLRLASRDAFDAVLLDVRLTGSPVDFDVLAGLLQSGSQPEVLLMTERGTPDEAEEAIKRGAWDYLAGPLSPRDIAPHLDRALHYRLHRAEIRPASLLKKETYADIVGSSHRMKSCLELLAVAAQGDANVLLSGETGTGKELFAWAIHRNSPRAKGRFVVVDCAALPEALVESILFGHEKGAFTGADKTRDGLIRRADGGTLFLDEVGELPLPVQKSFLRVLQERRFHQVGGTTEIRSDFRLIAASNRDLNVMVQRRAFRKDLLFRLRAFTVELPVLRERIEDVREIATHHVARLCRAYGVKRKGFSEDFFDVLGRYDWPGNVRELVSAIERAICASHHDPILFPKHLPTYIRVALARRKVTRVSFRGRESAGETSPGQPLPAFAEYRENALREAEQRYLVSLLDSSGGIREACRISGLSRSRLYALLKKYDLSPGTRKDGI